MGIQIPAGYHWLQRMFRLNSCGVGARRSSAILSRWCAEPTSYPFHIILSSHELAATKGRLTPIEQLKRRPANTYNCWLHTRMNSCPCQELLTERFVFVCIQSVLFRLDSHSANKIATIKMVEPVSLDSPGMQPSIGFKLK